MIVVNCEHDSNCNKATVEQQKCLECWSKPQRPRGAPSAKQYKLLNETRRKSLHNSEEKEAY
jgi:hypothetical protein